MSDKDIESDFHLYGVSYERINADGTRTRIAPQDVHVAMPEECKCSIEDVHNYGPCCENCRSLL